MKRRSCLKSLKSRRHTVGLGCPTGTNCRHAWRCALDQIFFFTSQRDVGSVFSWGAKFKSSKAKPEEDSTVEDTIKTFTNIDQSRKESLQSFDRLRRRSSQRKPSQELIDANNASLDKFETQEAEKSASHRRTENVLPPLNEQINENINGNRVEAKVKMRWPGANRGQATLQSRRIVISTEDLAGRDVARVVRQRMNALEEDMSPSGHGATVVRSTALIVKSSRNSRSPPAGNSGGMYVLLTPGEHTSVTTVIDGSPAFKPKNSMKTSQVKDKIDWESNNCAIAKSRGEGYGRQHWEWTGSQRDVVRGSLNHARSCSDSELRPSDMKSSRCDNDNEITTNSTEETKSKNVKIEKWEQKDWHKAFRLILPGFILLFAVLFSLFPSELMIFNEFVKHKIINGLFESINYIRNQYCIPAIEVFQNQLDQLIN